MTFFGARVLPRLFNRDYPKIWISPSNADTIFLEEKIRSCSLKIITFSAIWGALSFQWIAIPIAILIPKTKIAYTVITLFGSLIGGFAGYHRKIDEKIKYIPLTFSKVKTKNPQITNRMYNTFAKKFVQIFDKIKREEKVFPSFNDSSNEITSVRSDTSQIRPKIDPGDFQNLPKDIKAIIADYSADMSDWFAITGFFFFQNKDRKTMQTDIKNRLKLLGQTIENRSSKERQLLTYIFKETIDLATDRELELIFASAHPFRSTTRKIQSVFSRVMIKIYDVIYKLWEPANNSFFLALESYFFATPIVTLGFFPLALGLVLESPIIIFSSLPVLYLVFSPKSLEFFLEKFIHEIDAINTEMKRIHETKKREYLVQCIKQTYEIWMQLI